MEPIPEEIVERHIGADRQYCLNTDCESHVVEDRYGCKKWGPFGKEHPCPLFVPYRAPLKDLRRLPVAEPVGYIPDVVERKILKVEVLSRSATATSWIDTGVEQIPKYDITLSVKCEDGSTHTASEKTVIYNKETAKAKLLDGLIASLAYAKKEDKLKVIRMMFPEALGEVE